MVFKATRELNASDLYNLAIIKKEIQGNPELIEGFIRISGYEAEKDLNKKALQLVALYQMDPEKFEFSLDRLVGEHGNPIAAGIITGAATVLSTLVGGLFGLGKRRKAKKAIQAAKAQELIDAAKEALLADQRKKEQQAKILKAEQVKKRKRQRNTGFAIGGAFLIILVVVLFLTLGKKKLKK